MAAAAYKTMCYLTSLLILLVFTTPCMADNTVIQNRIMRLSLEEGKLMVLKNNLDIAVSRISPRIETENIKSAEGTFDPILSGTLQREDSATPLSSRSSIAAGGRTSAESETYSLGTGLSGISQIGTQYSIEFNYVQSESTFNNFNREYDAFAGIKITQPLLKNFGSDINRFNIIIAKKNRNISVNDLKQLVTNTLTEFKNAYWDLVRAHEELKVKEESMKLAESLLDLNSKRLKAEVISPLEVTQSEVGVASRHETLIMARNDVRKKENSLKKLISDDIYSLRNTEIIPLTAPVVSLVTLDLEKGFKEGIENRPDYEKLKTTIEKNRVTIKYFKNQRYPDIDLKASYGFNGLGNSFSDSFKDMDDNNEWSLGIAVKFPLGNRSAKGDLEIAQFKAGRELLHLKKLEQEILIEIDNAIRETETNMKRIEAATVSKHLAEKTLQAEEIKLKEGLSTSHDVLEFQEELVGAQSREISAIIDYSKSLVELSRVKGTVLKEEGIIISYDTINLVRR